MILTTIFFTIIIFIIIIVLFYFLIWKKVADINDIIKKLSRQAARWSVASKQDSNPIIGVLHANYGAGYLWAIKDIADDDQFKLATSLDMKEFEKNIIDAQDDVTKKLVSSCATVAPDNTSLIKAIYGTPT